MRSARRRIDWRVQVTPFHRKVYEAVLKIPRGEVRTYAWVARAVGRPKAARAVGQALKRNRWAPQIPCHRVIASDGALGGPAFGGTSLGRAAWRLPKKLLGGYSAPGGLAAKRRLLRKEGLLRRVPGLRPGTLCGIIGLTCAYLSQQRRQHHHSK